MKETTKQTLSIITITLLLAASIFTFMKVVWPKFQTYQDIQKEIREKDDLIGEIQKYSDLANSLYSTYSGFGNEISKIQKALPTSPNLADVLATLDILAKNAQLELASISFRELESANAATSTSGATSARTSVAANTNKVTPYKIIEINIDINNASYPAIQTFLGEVESELRLMDVYVLNMSSSPKTVKVGRTVQTMSSIKSDITIHTYYQP